MRSSTISSSLLPTRRSIDHSETSSDSPGTPSDSRNERAPLPRKPIPRKGHTKSRRGCFNCKRRRIKCNERHPECNHCIKAGLHCDYPANIIQSMQRTHTSPSPVETVHLQSTPGTFVSSPGTKYIARHLRKCVDNGRFEIISSLFDHCVSTSSSWGRQNMDHSNS